VCARFYVSYEGFNTDEAIKKWENYKIFYGSEKEYSEKIQKMKIFHLIKKIEIIN